MFYRLVVFRLSNVSKNSLFCRIDVKFKFYVRSLFGLPNFRAVRATADGFCEFLSAKVSVRLSVMGLSVLLNLFALPNDWMPGLTLYFLNL